MTALFNWIANRTLVKGFWKALDGKKTYAAAILGVCTSLAGLLNQLAPILSAHNTAGLLGFIQALPSNQSWLSLVASFGLLGLGHANQKAASALQTPAEPPPSSASSI